MWYVKSSFANVCRFVYACIETVAGVTASTERVEDRLVDEVVEVDEADFGDRVFHDGSPSATGRLRRWTL